MSTDAERIVEEAWASFDAHVIFDVTQMDGVLAAHEQKRYDDWADSLVVDPYDDGDED